MMTSKILKQSMELERLRDTAFAFGDKPVTSEAFHRWRQNVLKIVIETCGKNSPKMTNILGILEKLRRFRQFVDRARDTAERDLGHEVPTEQTHDKYSGNLYFEATELLQSILRR